MQLFDKAIYNSRVLVRIMQTTANNGKCFRANLSVYQKWSSACFNFEKRDNKGADGVQPSEVQ